MNKKSNFFLRTENREFGRKEKMNSKAKENKVSQNGIFMQQK